MSDRVSHDDGRPEWWTNNQRTRERMGLPEYEPPRFEDGAYKHEVIDTLETRYDCTIRFRSKNPRHPCEWVITVDGTEVGSTARRRTDRGNTVFRITSDELVDRVAASAGVADSPSRG
ncbi:hypothetical protein ACFQE1_04000 [Halobium palmae]|uniref:Uncharacterized protein n=1 Tax=Halobium palmae TaxID=1776492 RepID=A0ABD5RW76_9EURY